ncbi:MAG: RDD family protein [Elusimicrobiota bacterium]
MELATRGQRLIAQIIDVGALLTLGLLAWLGTANGPSALGLVFSALIIVFLLTQFVMLWKKGQTLGKIVMGIRIVRVDTQANGGFVTNVLLRTFLNSVITSIPILGPLYGLADALFIFKEDRRCLHDRLAKTCVIVA